MNQHSIIWLGYGDIAQRALPVLTEAGFACTGVSRRDKREPEHKDFIRGDLQSMRTLETIAQTQYDIAVITLSPGGRREQDYRAAYWQSTRGLLKAWQQSGKAPRYLIYISSTSVYSSDCGRVDEQSPTEPDGDTAKVLVETEALICNSGIPHSIVRFSGIYGPGRDFLQRQIKEGKGGNDAITNRIHVDDCVGVIAFLMHRFRDGLALPEIVLASDDEPVSSKEVRTWLAAKMGIEQKYLEESHTRSSNKCCDNALLKGLGYEFKYPSYKEGYEAVLGEDL